MSATLLEVETERGARTDLERLQGAWVTVAGRRPGLLLIAGHAFAIHFRDGDIYMGSLDVEPDEQPRLMHMRIGEGPLRHRGEIAPCIYEVDGDELRWCAAEPGSEVRLTAFPPVEDRRYLCMVFRREKA
jgi:uncharacterized protein (TIGR03067 family)